MSSERHQQLESLFSAALEKASSSEQAAFLEKACGTDPVLRASVEALLQAHCNAGNFLTPPALDPDATRDSGPQADRLGTRVGPYKILQQIGEGGFGTVYMAEQETPVRRTVALKIIKLGMDTKQVIARFAAERQALAMMDHPGIAKVLDAGATESGRPYFVMELVKGIPITAYCERNRLATRDRLTLFVQVCRAVQHAHQKGVIHRDLKPSNVLVALHDNQPVPKIIDFGIAKATSRPLTDKTLFTEFRQFIGTPEYMSPDQAEISGLDVDTRTDIYSLGILLYELLTGTTPFERQRFRQASYAEIQRIIREELPPLPSTRVHTLTRQGTAIAHLHRTEPATLFRLIRRDLDWIVMKAVEKDRTRRYDTAGDLASDVERHLNYEPVLARPPSMVYKFRKFMQRNRVAVLASVLVVAAMVCALVMSTTFYFRAVEERDLARRQSDRADREAARFQQVADYLQDLLISTHPAQALGHDLDVDRVVQTAREVLGDDHAAVAAALSSRALQLLSAGDLAAAEPLYRESLDIWRAHYADDHLNIALVLAGLGKLLEIKGDSFGAEEYYREALRETAGSPVEQQLALGETRGALASLLLNRGDYEEAEQLARETVHILRKTAPHQRLQLAMASTLLARTLIYAGQNEAARTVSMDTVEAFRHALPAKSALLGRVCTEFGLWNLQQGFDESAIPLLEEAAAIFRAIPNPPPDNRIAVLKVLYEQAKTAEGGYDDAVRLGEEYLEAVREVRGDENKEYAQALRAHAEYVATQDRPAQALAYMIEAIGALHNAGDLNTLDVAVEALRRMGLAVASQSGRSQREYESALEAVEIYLYKRPNTPDMVSTVGVLQYRLGRYTEALETLARAEELNAERHADGVPSDVAYLAMVHHRLGHAAEARRFLERLRQLMRRPEFAGDASNRACLAEAERLLGGAASGKASSRP